MGVPYLGMLIKPASGSCNMACRYCFYADVMENRSVRNYGIMKPDVMRALIDRALCEAEGECAFAFQGGEPTMAGLGYFEDFVSYAKSRNVKKLPLHFSIQTNGYAIDARWAAFFAREGFLVGLSLDGTEETNALFRLDSAGKPVFNRIMDAAKLFTEHKVDFNILTVVTAQTAARIHKIYPFYKQRGFKYHQYIPCIPDFSENSADQKNSGVKKHEKPEESFFLDAKTYGIFLKKLFDLWYDDMSKGKYVFVRYFENIAALIAGQRPESCGISGVCAVHYVIEADGSVYPCDFFVTDEWKLGMITESGFEQLRQTERAKTFIEQSLRQPPQCNSCQWLSLCRGGCFRDREPVEGAAYFKNRFCPTFKEFFPYAVERFQKLVREYVQPPR